MWMLLQRSLLESTVSFSSQQGRGHRRLCKAVSWGQESMMTWELLTHQALRLFLNIVHASSDKIVFGIGNPHSCLTWGGGFASNRFARQRSIGEDKMGELSLLCLKRHARTHNVVPTYTYSFVCASIKTARVDLRAIFVKSLLCFDFGPTVPEIIAEGPDWELPRGHAA